MSSDPSLFTPSFLGLIGVIAAGLSAFALVLVSPWPVGQAPQVPPRTRRGLGWAGGAVLGAAAWISVQATGSWLMGLVDWVLACTLAGPLVAGAVAWLGALPPRFGKGMVLGGAALMAATGGVWGLLV